MELYQPTEEELLREMRHVKRKNRRKRLAWGLLVWFTLAAAFGWYVFNRYYTLAVVQGAGMNDTLLSGSVILCRRTQGVRPKAGDVILFEHGDGWQLKRVAAVAGDSVALSQKGRLWINGKVLSGFKSDFSGYDAEMALRPVTVPEDSFFVLGDEYTLSVDSRSGDYGFVKSEDILAVAEYTVWPLYRAGQMIR
ncbi:MAG: signal peptidase I [Clostridia bacterium]|nr:signal peptidase I [Clostridia bacterium]